MGLLAGDRLRRRHHRIPYPELGEGASFWGVAVTSG
jgi:hypothetical protein